LHEAIFLCHFAGKREIEALRTRCRNVERGCEWVGTVGTLEQHVVASCRFTPVPCPNKCKNSNDRVHKFTRKDLELHLKIDCPNREHACQFCGEKGKYAVIMNAHVKACIKKKTTCTNAGCTVTMQRQQVPGHVHTECPQTVISCQYKSIGCTSQLKRKDMPAHERDTKLHLHMALDVISLLREQRHPNEVVLQQDRPMVFKLPDYQKKKDADEAVTSPPFYSHSNGYYMAVRAYANGRGTGKGTHVTLSAPILQGKHDSRVKWPFSGKVIMTALNQIEDKNHYICSTSIDETDDGSTTGKHAFIPHSVLAHDPDKNTQYLMDDTLYFRVEVEVDNHKPWLQQTELPQALVTTN
jgi:TNF receptor-associated factor 4